MPTPLGRPGWQPVEIGGEVALPAFGREASAPIMGNIGCHRLVAVTVLTQTATIERGMPWVLSAYLRGLRPHNGEYRVPPAGRGNRLNAGGNN